MTACLNCESRVVRSSVADRSFDLFGLGAFAATVLVLAIVGIYGVISYVVEQRAAELACESRWGRSRAASGCWSSVRRMARRRRRRNRRCCLLAARLMRTMLYGVTPNDPLTFLSMVAVLLVTALVACQVPAIRATRVDPLTAMRTE